MIVIHVDSFAVSCLVFCLCWYLVGSSISLVLKGIAAYKGQKEGA